MHRLIYDSVHGRNRDPARERRERQRYALLQDICERTGADCNIPVAGLAVGEAQGLTREETFRLIQSLAHYGFLHYVGAGPRVCITEKGVRYLEQEAGRRQSIRDT